MLESKTAVLGEQIQLWNHNRLDCSSRLTTQETVKEGINLCSLTE